MKILIALVLSVWTVNCASAQSPAAAGQQPAAAEIPAQPSGEKPAQPSGEKPAKPSADRPAQPSGDKPAQPSGEEPAQPGVITKRVDTTPEILQSPENSSFLPFHKPTTGQMDTPEKPQKLIRVDQKSGSKRLYTVPELKKKHSEELKALRNSLKKRPNSEIRKAVEIREAEQKAALKSLQDAIKTEAEKNQTGSPQPKPENEISNTKN